MNSPNATQTWIVDGLTALGGAATVDELLDRWQAEMRIAAEAMSAAGRLVVDEDSWSLPAGVPTSRPGRWTEEEIAVAVDAYILLLRADHEGRPANRRAATAAVLDRTGRDLPSVDAIFANISAVVQELGFEYLAAYPPKSNVPPGVRPAVSLALKA
ncbi:hypothetical protein [Aeromicrobium sp. P5_D10]